MRVRLLTITVTVMLLFAVFCSSEGDSKSKVDLPKQTTPAAVAIAAIDQPISNNAQSYFEQKVDSLRQIIPTVTGNQKFSFMELSQDVLDRRDVQTHMWAIIYRFTEMDSATWINNFNKPTKLGDHEYSLGGYGYLLGEKFRNTIYYYKIFDFKDDLLNLIILQYIHYNKSCMYLVQFDKQGNRKKTLLLAYIESVDDGFKDGYSLIHGNKITTFNRYEHYSNADEDVMKSNIVTRDTVVTLW